MRQLPVAFSGVCNTLRVCNKEKEGLICVVEQSAAPQLGQTPMTPIGDGNCAVPPSVPLPPFAALSYSLKSTNTLGFAPQYCACLSMQQMQSCVAFVYHLSPLGMQDDKAVDKAWKKESAEAGDGMGPVLYQLFKKRRSECLLVCSLCLCVCLSQNVCSSVRVSVPCVCACVYVCVYACYCVCF